MTMLLEAIAAVIMIEEVAVCEETFKLLFGKFIYESTRWNLLCWVGAGTTAALPTAFALLKIPIYSIFLVFCADSLFTEAPFIISAAYFFEKACLKLDAVLSIFKL